jgi:hypothetical protein
VISIKDRTIMISYQEKKIIDDLVINAEKRVRQARWAPVVGLITAMLFLVLAFKGVDLIETKSKPMLDAAWGGSTNVTDEQPVTHGELRRYAELQSLITVNKVLRTALDMSVVLVLIGSIWQVFRFRQKAQHELVQLRAIQFLVPRQTDIAEQSPPSDASTSRG